MKNQLICGDDDDDDVNNLLSVLSRRSKRKRNCFFDAGRRYDSDVRREERNESSNPNLNNKH